MSQREETEEGVRPPETPQCEQHGSQTEAQSPEQQRPDSPGLSMFRKSSWSTRSSLASCDLNHSCSMEKPDFSSSSDEKDVATDDGDLDEIMSNYMDSFRSSPPQASTGSIGVSVKSGDSSQGRINGKEER